MAQRFTPPTSTEPKAGGIPTPLGITDVPTGTGTILVVLIRHGTAPARPGGAGINRGGILAGLLTPGVLPTAVGDRLTPVGVLLMADGDRLIPDGVHLTADGDRLMGFRTRGDGMRRMAGAVHLDGAIPMDGMATQAIHLEILDSTAA
jgi:hypothetical protein